MKKILLFSLIICFSVASAQDKKATALLNEVAAKTQSYDNIMIDFGYKMVNKSQNIDETMNGVLFSKEEKYKLNVAGQQIISDGKTMWTYLESANEVQINEPVGDDESFNPKTFLKSWPEKFKVRFLNEKDHVALLELMPKESSSFTKVHIRVDKNKMQLLSLTMFDGNGSEFQYSIKRFVTNQIIPDSEFSFDPQNYPGVEVIDLR